MHLRHWKEKEFKDSWWIGGYEQNTSKQILYPVGRLPEDVH